MAGVGGVSLATIALAIALVGPRARSGPTASEPARPNVVLVTLDTTRADRCSAFGYERPTTPRLGALLPTAVRFAAAYAPMPMTLPSHATMFSGLLPRSHGVLSNGLVLGEEVVTLAERLRDAGYRTAGAVSALPLARRFGIAQGFTDYFDSFAGATCDVPLPPHLRRAGRTEPFCRRGDDTAALATQWLATKGYAERTGADRRPFFLWVHLFDAHAPYAPPPEHAALFPALGGADDAAAIEGAAYDAEIHFADAQLGRIVDHLADAEILDDTLLIVAGDHGEGLGEHGWRYHGPAIYDEAVRVPLLVRWPRAIPGGRTIDVPVALVDLAPTVLDLAGVGSSATPPEARSLAAALRGEAELDAQHPVLLERRSYRARRKRGSPVRGEGLGVRVGAWKYIEAPEEERRELYDLTNDPCERTNLAEVHADTARRLAGILAAWSQATSPPRIAPAAVTREDLRRLEALGYVE